MNRQLRTVSPRRPRRVAVLVDPGDSWGRGVIRGITSAVDSGLNWELLLDPRDDEWRYRVPRNWQGDGIIAAVRDEQTARHLREQNVPGISVTLHENPREERYLVITDDRQRAELAFAHFQDRGFEHFAYYGPPSLRYTRIRGEHFRDVLAEAGLDCHLFRGLVRPRNPYALQQQTAKWLKRLPRPLAVFAADPYPALQLSAICKQEGFRIPEEIAILSGDTDDLMCEVAVPPLSSIILASEQLGAESVHLLARLMDGEPIPAAKIEIPPLGIRQRHSTDVIAVDDTQFAHALQFIRMHAHLGIQVKDVLKTVPVSRRWLEQKFRQILNRSPADEIRRMKLEQVKRLLMATDLSLDEIAVASGYSSASRLSFLFRQATHQTPMTYRKTHRSNLFEGRFSSLPDKTRKDRQ